MRRHRFLFHSVPRPRDRTTSFLLLSYHLLLHEAQPITASPTSTILATRAITSSDNGQDIIFNTHYRSGANIIWSSIATIFACTWISVHPNIAGYRAPWWKHFGGRVELMLWAIIAPELIILWAYRQWLGARRIPRLIERRAKGENIEFAGTYEWTLVHSHFLQMGGFILQDETGVSYNLDKAITAIPRLKIAAAEISDRSKGDAFTKGFALIQTLWFIAQRVARGVQGLTITETEIITLAYAALNGCIYAFWWDQPLDVQCPVVVSLQPEDRPRGLSLNENEPDLDTVRTGEEPTKGALKFVLSIVDIIRFFYRRLRDITESDHPRRILPHATSVPTFYAYRTTHRMENLVQIVAAGLAAVFGAIHCSAWYIAFPSATNQLLWRISAIYICISPMFVIPPRLYTFFEGVYWERSMEPVYWGLQQGSKKITKFWLKWTMRAAYYVLFLYIPARIILITLACLELQDLSASAHQTVEWTGLIPHVYLDLVFAVFRFAEFASSA